MSRTRWIAVAVFAALCASPLRASAAKGAGGEVLIGYVNVQRAILEVDEGKRARDSLKSTFEEKQKKLTAMEEELKKLKDAIDKPPVATAKDDKAATAQKAQFQQKLMELQQVYMKEQQELQEAQAKQVSAITDKMRKIINEIGEQGGYTLILEGTESRLLFARPHLDLTNEVIRKYNLKHK